MYKAYMRPHFPFLRKSHIQSACFFYIFKPVPDGGFLKKPKLIALLDNKTYCLKT